MDTEHRSAMGDLQAVATLDEAFTEIMILSTARRHGRGVQRLPDRIDRGRRVAALQIENDEQARAVLKMLDRPGRRFYLDVERKQDVNLMAVAGEAVVLGVFSPIKPNDTTVDALEAVLLHQFGNDLTGLVVAINGTGNLGFKFALRLAEMGCRVSVHGRNSQKVQSVVEAINAILPRHTLYPLGMSIREGSLNVLVSAVNAEHVVTPSWLPFLAPGALCLDVGINNLTPDFIENAHRAGHACARLDVRSAGDPLPAEPNPFFKSIAGRRLVGGSTMVAGGAIGQRGDVVVDQIQEPKRILGVANGTGGLLPREGWTVEISEKVSEVQDYLSFDGE